jgi:Mannosyltransferase (PIG-V)
VRVLRHPAGTFLAIRVAFLVGTALALVWAPVRGDELIAYRAYDPFTDLLFGAFAQWDSDWYLFIAEHGYDGKAAAFFPLYPALVYVLGAVIGSNLVAGVLISLAAGAVAAWAIAEIARPLLGHAGASDSVLLLALYPTAFVFTAAYSEGLFLALAATSFLAAQRGRPWLAGVLAGLAVGTRVAGLALIPALVLLLWPRSRLEIPRLAPVILLPLMGLAAVTLVFDQELGNAFAFSDAQRFWERDPSRLGPVVGLKEELSAVWNGLGELGSIPRELGEPDGFSRETQVALWNLVDLLALAAAVALTVVAYRRLGPAFAAYSVGLLVIATSAPARVIPFQSMGRFLMVDFPLLLAGASLLAGRPALRTGTLVTLGAVTAVAGAAFARKLWVA